MIIGTAGHIDHGKSALVQALTGTDPDRWAEEKARGMTIDIGFAFLGESIAFVDVPGHERFVKNMVTGAAAIDAAVLVVAADDGMMPQTREHLDILRMLQIPVGIVVISKIDLVDDEWLGMLRDELREWLRGSFLENQPVFAVSSRTGEGIAELQQYLLQMPQSLAERTTGDLFRMPIDRSFSVSGRGTIVTGSIVSGCVNAGDRVEIYPLQESVRVRGIESNHRQLETLGAGQRCALNLQGLPADAIGRGCFVAACDRFLVSRLLTCYLELLDAARMVAYNDTVRVHLGTGEYLAQVRWIGRDQLSAGEESVAQLLFREPVSAAFRERLILRSISPMHTIGGGVVLDVQPERLRKKDVNRIRSLVKMREAPVSAWIAARFAENRGKRITPDSLAQRFSLSDEKVRGILGQLQDDGKIVAVAEGYVAQTGLERIAEQIRQQLKAFHHEHPILSGMRKADLAARLNSDTRLMEHVLQGMLGSQEIHMQGGKIRLIAFRARRNHSDQKILTQLETEIRESGFTPPSLEDLSLQLDLDQEVFQEYVTVLVESKRIVIPEKGIVFHIDTIQRGSEHIRQYLGEKGSATVSELKELLGTSRKWALPLLNFYDRQGLTYRKGDRRFLQN